MFPSTISSWTLVIANAAEEAGIDYKELFKQAGADPDKLMDPNARYAYPVMVRLWKILSEKIDDPCFGLKAIEQIRPTTFHALGYAWFASATLKDALERLVRYYRLLSTSVDTSLVYNQQECEFNIWVKEGLAYPPDRAQDTSMATMIKLCRMSYGDEFNANRLVMKRPVPECKDEFETYFRCPMEFSSNESKIVFDLDLLERTLPSANAELAHANDKIIMQRLADLDRNDIISNVKKRLIEAMPSGNVTESHIAGSLHMSLRTLQRKLDQEGTSYKKILEDTRRSLASEYVKDSNMSITEITYMLGFSEPSNFTRAYKRWHGVSPSTHRVVG